MLALDQVVKKVDTTPPVMCDHSKAETSIIHPQEKMEVLGEGEIVPGVQGTRIFHYSDLEELMKSISVPRPCPIHYGQMEELKSKKEDNHDVFRRCPQNCAFFYPEKEYEVYYYNCR